MEGAFLFFVMMTAVGSLLSGYVENVNGNHVKSVNGHECKRTESYE